MFTLLMKHKILLNKNNFVYNTLCIIGQQLDTIEEKIENPISYV